MATLPTLHADGNAASSNDVRDTSLANAANDTTTFGFDNTPTDLVSMSTLTIGVEYRLSSAANGSTYNLKGLIKTTGGIDNLSTTPDGSRICGYTYDDLG